MMGTAKAAIAAAVTAAAVQKLPELKDQAKTMATRLTRRALNRLQEEADKRR